MVRATGWRAQRLRAAGIAFGPGSAAGSAAWLVTEAERPVVVPTLGGFQVIVASAALPTTAWRSRKARDLLRLLCARRGHPAARDVLTDALWPDEAPEVVGSRFSVALSTLRRVLDPDHRYPADHFVSAQAGAVAVDLHHVDVDVERFLRVAAAALGARGEARMALLAEAEQCYTGDFCEDDPYGEWAVPLREEVRAAYLAVARAVAVAADGMGDGDLAVRACLRLLERDPFDEDGHLRLVAILRRLGRHGEAHRRYRLYAARMAELAVEPAPFPA